ncbi:Rid family hydrolase (plasmid) [Rhodococcus globerulus]|uniref:Rid family hydrolase n=1 Tax=Rhodococcus globerulus TaxID=33008 RepID=UPI0039E8A818
MSKPEFFFTPGYGEPARDQYNYSQAVRIDKWVEISGQGGWDSDFTFSNASLEEEIVKSFDNIEKTLAHAGATWQDVVAVYSYHVPTADDSIGNEHNSVMVDQFRKRMGDRMPLWTELGVKALGLPEMHVEVRVTAYISSDE